MNTKCLPCTTDAGAPVQGSQAPVSGVAANSDVAPTPGQPPAGSGDWPRGSVIAAAAAGGVALLIAGK